MYELSIWSKHGWATNRAKEIYIYALYIFRIQCFIVPTDIIKPNTKLMQKLYYWLANRKHVNCYPNLKFFMVI